MGEPVSYETTQYYKDMNPENFHFAFAYSHHRSLSFLAKKKKSHKTFSDVLEDQILPSLRKIAEYKNLLSQLQPSFPLPSSGSTNLAYQELSTSYFEDMYSIYSISDMFEKPFPADSWITIGLKGSICQNCLKDIYVPVFFKIEGTNDRFEPQHECLELGPLYSVEEKDDVLNNSNMNLTKQMTKLIKVWTGVEKCLVIAREIDEHPVIGEINNNQNDDWSARAIRDNSTTLKDDNELTDFLAKTNNSTFGMFKVYSIQQSSPRFYLFMIIKKEWL
jgi:hypothetical protein